MSLPADGQTTAPPYNGAHFVNREPEIELVTAKAQRLSLGDLVRKRTIIFRSFKGTGRTWLLRRLEEKLQDLPGITPLYIDLQARSENPSDEMVTAIVGNLVRFARQILGRQVGEPDAAARAQKALPQDITDLLREHVLVLLLDHVCESDWSLLALLEDRFLAHLAPQPRVLLVIACRGQAYHWKTPELRLNTDEHRLEAFDQPDTTRMQLERLNLPAASRYVDIHNLSGGYPYGNRLLATSTESDALQAAVDALLTGIPPEKRSWLEALCILRVFDEERLARLLAVYFGNPVVQDWSYREIRQHRQELLHTKLVDWQTEAGGWAIDSAIGPLLERYLREKKLQTWRRLHCAAYHLYLLWAAEYPDEAQRWQNEADYHAGCLRAANQDPEQCPED